jgi:hypothetical protein
LSGLTKVTRDMLYREVRMSSFVVEEFLTRVTRSLIALHPGTMEWQGGTWRVAQVRNMGVQCDGDMEDEVGNARNAPPPQTRYCWCCLQTTSQL